MKTLRKSLNGHKDHSYISSPVSPLPSISKPISTVQPPKKVIRALNSHRATAPQELSFEKGDFFHVVNDVGHGQWYEAHNPMTGARGLVPSAMFEVFSKGGAGTTPGPQTPKIQSFVPGHAKSPSSPKVPVYFAVVLHDFVAERADELDAKAGDAISVVAQSNREWFVAKPIGRLGRPGLIPVTFVEVRDPGTGQAIQDVDTLIDSGALPRVEEWKKAVMNYKANSISLGVLDEATTATSPHSAFSQATTASAGPAISVQAPSPNYQPPPQQQPSPQTPEDPIALPEGILLSADVKSFHFEMDDFWFRVHAIYQPYPFTSAQPLPNAKQLVLFRSYNDFYDFQIDILDAFPTEGGRTNKESRILPYMPGPVDHVDNAVTNMRRGELDIYLHELCELQHTARYIVESPLVRQFLAQKPGDAEVEIEPCIHELERLDRASAALNGRHESSYSDSVQAQFSKLNVSDQRRSEVSDYGDGGHAAGRAESGAYDYRMSEQYTSPTPQPLPQHAIQSHNRNASTASAHNKQPPKLTTRGLQGHSRSSSRTNSPLPTGKYPSLDMDPNSSNGYSRSSLASSSHEPSPVSMRSSQSPSVATSATSASGRSRSQSNAAMNTPPISATNPQTAFIKIKIFHRASDDLVAIRVHPKVTHLQLMDKVQARLGGNIHNLQFRDSLSHEFIGLDSDADLRSWLEGTERHVLYAE